MSDDQQMMPAGRTETVIRRFDKEGKLIEEHTTVITHMEPKPDEKLPIGQYL